MVLLLSLVIIPHCQEKQFVFETHGILPPCLQVDSAKQGCVDKKRTHSLLQELIPVCVRVVVITASG